MMTVVENLLRSGYRLTNFDNWVSYNHQSYQYEFWEFSIVEERAELIYSSSFLPDVLSSLYGHKPAKKTARYKSRPLVMPRRAQYPSPDLNAKRLERNRRRRADQKSIDDLPG